MVNTFHVGLMPAVTTRCGQSSLGGGSSTSAAVALTLIAVHATSYTGPVTALTMRGVVVSVVQSSPTGSDSMPTSSNMTARLELLVVYIVKLGQLEV